MQIRYKKKIYSYHYMKSHSPFLIFCCMLLVTIIGTGNLVVNKVVAKWNITVLQSHFSWSPFYKPVKAIIAMTGHKITFSSPLKDHQKKSVANSLQLPLFAKNLLKSIVGFVKISNTIRLRAKGLCVRVYTVCSQTGWGKVSK